jgi:ATP-dependent DNA helicase RecG
MAISVKHISAEDAEKILSYQEGHFGDLKSKTIGPAKITRSMSAFANAEGGEIYLGVREDKHAGKRYWEGFADEEDANGHIQAFEQIFPLGADIAISFLAQAKKSGLVLKVEISKTKDIKRATDGVAYVRRGAQNLPITNDADLRILERNKGITSFESETLQAPPEILTESDNMRAFIREVVPQTEPLLWLKKQMLITNDMPTVAGAVLFADEPQAVLPKRTGIKIYRYDTSEKEGTRETLAFNPLTIDGNGYGQIKAAVAKTAEIIESIRVNTAEGMQPISYPREALHETITNAVLHRDYSVTDDIHIVIFNNRVEIRSPGSLPGHVTPANILNERFARNPTIVRLMNKFPDAPNKDVGEGLNTVFEAMRKMKLREPVVIQEGGYVTVELRHEPLASPEERILGHLETNSQITNRIARGICHIGSENKMKAILQKMVKNNILEQVPTTTRYNAAYRLKSRRLP